MYNYYNYSLLWDLSSFFQNIIFTRRYGQSVLGNTLTWPFSLSSALWQPQISDPYINIGCTNESNIISLNNYQKLFIMEITLKEK